MWIPQTKRPINLPWHACRPSPGWASVRSPLRRTPLDRWPKCRSGITAADHDPKATLECRSIEVSRKWKQGGRLPDATGTDSRQSTPCQHESGAVNANLEYFWNGTGTGHQPEITERTCPQATGSVTGRLWPPHGDGEPSPATRLPEDRRTAPPTLQATATDGCECRRVRPCLLRHLRPEEFIQ